VLIILIVIIVVALYFVYAHLTKTTPLVDPSFWEDPRWQDPANVRELYDTIVKSIPSPDVSTNPLGFLGGGAQAHGLGAFGQTHSLNQGLAQQSMFGQSMGGAGYGNPSTRFGEARRVGQPNPVGNFGNFGRAPPHALGASTPGGFAGFGENRNTATPYGGFRASDKPFR